MKRVTSILLAIAFVVTFSVGTFAFEIDKSVLHSGLKAVDNSNDNSGQEWFYEHVDSLVKVIKSNLEINGLNADFITIGSPIKTLNRETIYMPVMDADNNFLSMVCLAKNELTDDFHVTVGCFFADKLNQLDKEQVYAVVEDSNGSIFAISEKQIALLQLSPSAISEQEAIQNLDDASLNIAFDNFVDVQMNGKMIDISNLTIQNVTIDGLGFAWWLYNYRPVLQYSDGLCWAASMASIINTWKDTSYTARNVADICGKSYNFAATYADVQYFFSTYFGMASSYYAYYLYLSDITSEIQAGRAIYQTLSDDYGGNGHAVILMGYQLETDPSICEAWVTIMDPALPNSNYVSGQFKLDPSHGPTVKTIKYSHYTSAAYLYNIH